ncbi:MAG: Bro-N domain-containing protein [Candidatus Dojkabacteria bacterium]|jgi:hypothetical protein
MKENNTIKLFQNKKIRVEWNSEKEEWLFSIVDIIGVLTESPNPRNYWKVLKFRLQKENSQLVTNCNQLKLKSSDGKYYKTDVANTEQILRIIQSIPSPKAEPFKLWLARVGKERIDETIDPELTIDRALRTYQKKGYSKAWINQRLQSIQVRKELTDEWEERGVKRGFEFGILTDEITKAWSDLTTRKYKELKGLTKENLRDNMSTIEIVLNMLAEASTTEISKEVQPKNFDENKKVAKLGGNVAGNARKEIEKTTKKSIITNRKTLQ